MASITKLTVEDFENLPGELAHNHELVDGERCGVGEVWMVVPESREV
jgi:hypothetical protein